jgi:hypothetical protein
MLNVCDVRVIACVRVKASAALQELQRSHKNLIAGSAQSLLLTSD